MILLWLIILTVILPIGFGLILRATGAPGWFAIGGVLAGVLVGPSILGVVFSDWHQAIFNGSSEESRALDELLLRQERDRIAANAAGLDLEQHRRLRLDQIEARRPLEAARDEAVWRHRATQRWLVAIVIMLALLAAGPLRVPRGPPIAGLASSLGIGLWSALGPGAAAFSILHWLAETPLPTSLCAAAAVAIGPWALSKIDRDSANGAEDDGAGILERAGVIASLLALLTIAAAVSISPVREPMWALVLLAHPAGWLIRPYNGFHASRAFWRRFSRLIILPPLAAMSVAFVETTASFGILLALAVMILSGDGRWAGGIFGGVALGGRRGLKIMRLTLGTMAAGPTQFAVTALGVQLDLLPGRIALPLALGALLLDVLAPLRRRVASELWFHDSAEDASG
jgi:hypothetical protein